MQIITKSILILSLLLTMGCGFKVLDKSNVNNFTIKEISANGNNRINYKIKNYLLSNTQKNNTNVLTINIKTKITKEIQEKNIKNEITKYKIDISASVIFNKVGATSKKSFTVSRSSVYDTATQYSQTLNNEKREIEMLTDEITQDIFDKLIKEVNDL